MKSAWHLFKTRQFSPLFFVQFLGAFNDNIFKNTVAIVLTFQGASWTNVSAALLAPLVGAIFILPFFLFSAFAGEIADRYDKALIIRIVKVFEILLMIGGLIAFMVHSFNILLLIIFGLGIHSTFFGPIKYAILPQHVELKKLVAANSFVESGTFVAILLGSVFGGVLANLEQGGVIASISGILFALMGYRLSKEIPNAPSYHQENYPLTDWMGQFKRSLKIGFESPLIGFSIIAISLFWLYGSILLSQFPIVVKESFQGKEILVTILLAVFTIGIGLGSLICERFSRGKISTSLMLVGAFGLGIFGVDFSIVLQNLNVNAYEESYYHLLIAVGFIGLFGGLLSVPFYTLLQQYSLPQKRSRVIAANNIINALFMVFGAISVVVFTQYGLKTSEILLISALLSSSLLFAISYWIDSQIKKEC